MRHQFNWFLLGAKQSLNCGYKTYHRFKHGSCRPSFQKVTPILYRDPAARATLEAVFELFSSLRGREGSLTSAIFTGELSSIKRSKNTFYDNMRLHRYLIVRPKVKTRGVFVQSKVEVQTWSINVLVSDEQKVHVH